MITKNKRIELIDKSLKLLKKAHIIITSKEAGSIETADFGLGEPERTGLQLIVYLNTERCCAKELILLPGQTCPQHKHPPVASKPGKEETFRCRWGQVYLYVEGKPIAKPKCKPPKGCERYYTVRHQIVLNPGQQYTLAPDTWHWFQAGPKGSMSFQSSPPNPATKLMFSQTPESSVKPSLPSDKILPVGAAAGLFLQAIS